MSRHNFTVIIVLAGILLAGGLHATKATDPSPGEGPTRVELALPDGWPDSFTVSIPLEDGIRLLELTRHSWRSPRFRVLVSGPSRTLVEKPVLPSRTYRGHVRGLPESTVVASLDERGIFASVLEDTGGKGWSVRPLAADDPVAPRTIHLIGPSHELGASERAPFPSAGEEVWQPDDEPIWVHTAGEGPSIDSHPGRSLAEISFDADNAYYIVACGSSLQACIDRIEFIMAQVDAIYARDAKVTYTMVEIVVRETPYYTANGDAGAVLGEFRDEWNTNPVYLPRDMAHLMTERSTPGIGGVAYAGCVVCGDFAYGLSHDSLDIVAHELGHNWSLPHCADPIEAPFQRNIMCGGDRQIGPNDTDSIHACRTSIACLDDVGPHPDPLAPYAYPERSRSDDAALGPLTLDPIANDFDGNDDTLALAGADPFSTRQGSLAVSPGTGPGGRDELVYTPPAGGFLGVDKFLYQVEDTTGRTRTGLAKIEATTPEIVGYWPLDETTGSLAEDKTAFDRDGQLVGLSFDTSSAPGRFGGGLDFSANNQAVSMGGPDVPPPWTVSLWVNRKNPGTLASALLDSPAYSLRLEQWPATLQVGMTHYGVADYLFNYTAPIGTFIHMVFVGTETETQLWIDGVLVETLAVSIHAPMATISKDGLDGLRAVLDDVRVFNHALDAAAIQELFDGGRATAPRPRHRERRASTAQLLSWAAAGGALEHDVYFGTDETAVAGADTTSPEYQGRQTGTTFNPTLTVGTTYYWRIDEVMSGGAVLPGDVWWFTAVDPLVADLVGHLPFDLTTLDYSGSLAGGSSYGDPPQVAGQIDSALEFSAGGQYLLLPGSPDVGPPWTASMWVKRQSSPGPAAYLLDANESSLRLEQWFNTKRVGFSELGLFHHTFNYEAPIDQWVHLVFVGTSTQTRLYVNGVLTDSIAVSIAMPRERLGNTNGDLRAAIDDVAMWDRELTDTEIQSIHTAGLGGRSFTCTRGVPGEVTQLMLSREAPGSPVAVLSWDAVPGAESYDIHRADSPDLSDVACLLTGIAGTSTSDDGALPGPGRVFHYVSAAVTCAGSSTLGTGTSAARPAAPACP